MGRGCPRVHERATVLVALSEPTEPHTCANECSHLRARLFYGCLGLPAVRMRTRVRIAVARHFPGQHSV